MANLASFNVTESFQELIGVSGVLGNFTIQNTGGNMLYIFIGAVPNFLDANQVSKTCYFENTSSEQVWVATTSDDKTKISIQEDL